MEYYCLWNSDSELLDGRTVITQYNTYQLKLSGHVTIGTYDYDNERHASVTKFFIISDNKPNKDQEKVLLLEMW